MDGRLSMSCVRGFTNGFWVRWTVGKGTAVAEKVDKDGQSINGGRYSGLKALMVVEKGLFSRFGVRGVSHGCSGLWRLGFLVS